jgi:hypothetical protein
VASLTGNPPTPANPPGKNLPQVIREELEKVQKSRAELMVPDGRPVTLVVTLVICVLINDIFFNLRTDYFGLFIAASFYLNMYYFITLLLPTNFEAASVPGADLTRLQAWLKEIGLKSGTRQFTRLFINSFFINNRGLSFGIALIFSIDILFVVLHYFSHILPLSIAIAVIAQCAVIVIFYLLVWKIEPFSTTYVKKVEGMKTNLHQKKIPPQFIAGIFLFGFMLALFLFLTTIIFLPGVTVNAFLDMSRLTEIEHIASMIAILAISQYFIIRFIHGITSRTMAERLFDFKENSLQELLKESEAAGSKKNGSEENSLDISAALLESKIFIVKRSSLAGAFPVFLVDLDFMVMMDAGTQTAIKGYIDEHRNEPGGNGPV